MSIAVPDMETDVGVSLTVRGLTEIPYLKTRLYAGAAGADRIVSAAHVLESRTPWEWLEAGDLLMTLGYGIPSDPQQQVTYVDRLCETGVCGIALGDDCPVPRLSEAMIEAAERCALPILFVDWAVPFAQISRTVAAANYDPQFDRSVQAIRVYDLLRDAVASRSEPAELFQRLSKEIGCPVYVVGNSRGRVVFSDASSLPPALQDVFLATLAEHGGKMPGFLRLPFGTETVLIVPIPTKRPSYLLALPGAEAPPFALLQHVATVAALELERMWSSREELRRHGSETLAQLVDGRMIHGMDDSLERLGIGHGPLIALAISETDGSSSIRDLHNTLADEGIANLLLQRGELLFVLLAGREPQATRIAELLPDTARAGASESFLDRALVPRAIQQAKWALGAATVEHRLVHHDNAASLFGPRSPAEARILVNEVLGSLFAYDREHGTELVKSLRVFLQSNRSWKQATSEMFVHKQTLVYRMRRIEQVTGRKLNDTADVAELWLALRASKMV
jgi:purine catabolism regulator